MNASPSAPPTADSNEFESALRFFRQWLREPRSLAALAPSSRELARHMAAGVGRGARTVIELGGGTGVVTQALLARGIPAAGLLILEKNPELHRHLHARFPGVQVDNADAFDLVEIVRHAGHLKVGKVDAVVSSLGLLNMSDEDQHRLLDAAFRVLRPGGRFVQFSYAPKCPVSRALRDQLGLESKRQGWSLLNLPPAFVYVLRRRPR